MMRGLAIEQVVSVVRSAVRLPLPTSGVRRPRVPDCLAAGELPEPLVAMRLRLRTVVQARAGLPSGFQSGILGP